MDTTVIGSKKWLINFYQEQLDYFHKVGLGKFTTHDVKITPTLLECTAKRLRELTTIYDAKLTPQALRLRKLRINERLKKERSNGHTTTSNGAVKDKSCKDIRTNGHERSKS